MKIGILGAGHIGASLARVFAKCGHEVTVANSRGPDTIPDTVLEFGARAAVARDAVIEADVVITSVPLSGLPGVVALMPLVPTDAVIVDTSNYYPSRDGTIDALEDGRVESEWVGEQLGRPVIKAWNAIGSDSLANRGRSVGISGRIALPVAGDDVEHRELALKLVEQSGFDAYDAGILADSWRQQAGNPCYCTDLTLDEMPDALAKANRARSPMRRDLAVAAITERMGDATTNPDADYLVRLYRALFM